MCFGISVVFTGIHAVRLILDLNKKPILNDDDKSDRPKPPERNRNAERRELRRRNAERRERMDRAAERREWKRRAEWPD